jgi:hypothetical protein
MTEREKPSGGEPPAKKRSFEQSTFLVGNSGKKLQKVISGGQIGADRAALEAAYECGFETGGMAPPRFMTGNGSDRTLQTKFGLRELVTVGGPPLAGYPLRSMMNVDDSDLTIAFRTHATAGTDKTIGYCETKKWKIIEVPAFKTTGGWRKCLIISDLSEKRLAAERIAEFVRRHRPETINVCGHRDDFNNKTFDADVEAILKMAFKKIKLAQSAPV